MTLDRYFAARYLRAFLLVLAVFLALVTLLELVEQMRRYGGAGLGLRGALSLALLSAPAALYGILPLIALLAALVLCLGLARGSELVASRAAGLSALRSLAGPAAMVLALGAFAVGVLNPLVAATQLRYEVATQRLQPGEDSVLSVSAEGLWLRQGGAEGQTVIRASRADLDGTRFYDATFLTFAPTGSGGPGPVRRIEATEARLGEGEWILHQAKTWDLTAQNPERDATRADILRLPTDLTFDRIRDSFGTPESIPVWQLPAFIAQLETAGFAALDHRVWFHIELSQPLFLLAMLLLGASMTMRHVRLGRTAQSVLAAVVLGFGLFLIRDFAQVLGESGQIAPPLAAWSPPVAGILLALGLILTLEDG